MTNERFIELFDKSRSGVLSESEAMEWHEWIGLSDHNREMVERLHDEENLNRTVTLLAKARQEDWQDITQKHPELKREEAVVKHMNPGMRIRVWIAAAVAILLIAITTYRFFYDKASHQKLATTETTQIQDLSPPDITKATITLANGHVVALDTLTSGVMQGKVNVVKTSDEQISYKKATGNGEPGETTYNTLTNPRGSKIVSISLSDGTKIWLNSESTLRYPVVFNGNERSVALTGEAYFEVAHSGKKKPFYVTANDVRVEVLGTHFNVNNYKDESAIKVTLLEGSVKVRSDRGGLHSAVVIKPGEQASISQISETSHPIPVQTADVDHVLSWKNNTFYFNDESLPTIMKQLSRFYNVEVVYEGDISDKRFGGMINRNKTLNEVLNVLELSGVHFRTEGKKIIVHK
jgi:transmembrane sensor